MNFEQILKAKMQDQGAQNASSQKRESLDAQGIDPIHLAFLMGKIGRTQAAPKGNYKAPPAKPRPAHVLNESQTAAFNFMLTQVSELTLSFTRDELKKAFRQAALKLHPDQGGTDEDFVQLREHYKTLSSVFAAKAA